jgi:hypothetical protein
VWGLIALNCHWLNWQKARHGPFFTGHWLNWQKARHGPFFSAPFSK